MNEKINKSKNTSDKHTTSLSKHKRVKKNLIPPFLQINNLKMSSWINDRLPEMLWAVIIIGNLERNEALNFFRTIAKFVQNNPECFNITLSGISHYEENKRKELINIMINYSVEIKKILNSLILFDNLPAFSDWKIYLDENTKKEDWFIISQGVIKAFNHQSQEATDCRWVKVLCFILSGKVNFLKGQEDIAKEILYYPDYGDLRKVRPTIRAMEINQVMEEKNKENNWAKEFWIECYKKTNCIPEEIYDKKIVKKQNSRKKEFEKFREKYLNETRTIINEIANHFFNNINETSIESRHEGAFGLALFALTIFIEIILYRIQNSLTSRLALRTLVENYIIFKYLLKKEKKENRIWDIYRNYGTGQIKLVFLKLKELKTKTNCIDLEMLDFIANEDQWLEFVPINIGNWDNNDLRKMSEEVKLKDLYDKFYNYTSGYSHSNWGAVRESVYQKCINPLHRFDRIPSQYLPLMLNVINDSVKIMNKILDCLSKAYPEFSFRINKIK